MSIGNRKSEGDKGSNYSYRLKHLKLLQNISLASGLGATEATAQLILSAIQNGQDYESKIVEDATGATFIEVRIYEPDPGTWLPPVYYRAGDNTPYVLDGPVPAPQSPVVYINNGAVLTQIYAELLDQGLSLDQIDLNTDDVATQTTLAALLAAFNAEDFAQEVTSQLINSNIVLGNLTLNGIKTQTDLLNFIATALEVNVTSSALPTGAATEVTQVLNNTALGSILAQLDVDLSTRASEFTLASLNAKLNTLGQKASAASAPVVLSTEQEVILDAIKTAVESIDSDLGTGGLALETTQQAIETLITSTNALLTTIDADTSNLDVLLSTRAADASVLATNALLTTIDGVLDAIKVDTGALVVDVAAIEVLITTTNSLLTTIDGVLDAIKLDTANLDVALSTVATELTVAKLLDPIGTDSVAHGASQKGIRALGTDGTNDQQISTDVDGKVNVLVAAPVALDALTLLALETVQIGNAGLGNAVNIQDGGNSITVDNTNLDTALTPATRTHNYAVSNGVGSVPAGSLCGSVLNNGNSVGTWNGNALPAGVSIPWSPIGAARDTYGAIAFDATGTEFIIEYTT